MKLNIQNWKDFKINKLFNITAGKYYNSNDYEEGDTPYVSAATTNNGVRQKISLLPDFDGNKIVTGKVECKAFYQLNPFSATSDANVFTPKFDMSTEVGLFLTTIITFNENNKWSYGRQCRVGDSNKIIIKLPVQSDKDGNPLIDSKKTYSDDGYVPDWKFMKEYIKTLHHKPLSTCISNKVTNSLNVSNWGEFILKDLFDDVYKAKAHTKEEVSEVDSGMHFVSRTELNNGIDISVLNDNLEGIEEANCITIGDTTATCFYQREQFITGDHMVILRASWLNVYTGLFIVTLLNQEKYRYSYGRAYKKDNILNTRIKLPINDDGTPNWEEIEKYIKSLPYSDRLK